MTERRFGLAVLIVTLLAGTLMSLGGMTRFPQAAYASMPKTITGKADITITNKQQAYYEGAVAQCQAVIHLPDGSTQTAHGSCISGIHYAVPHDGTYDYTGTLQPDGGYAVIIHSNVSAGANAGSFIPGEMWGTQQMGKIHLRYTPKITVRFTKTSANTAITKQNGSYSLQGAVYDIFEADGDKKVASIVTDERGLATCSLKPQTPYYAVETKAPAGFGLHTGRIEFSTKTSDSSVALQDEPRSVRLVIKKKDSATAGEAQVGATLKGAQFDVTSSTPGWHASGTTDANGSVTFESVPLGTITVVEVKAPQGYTLDPKPHSYTVDATQTGDTHTIQLSADGIVDHVIAFDIDIVKFQDTGADRSGLQEAGAGVQFQIISNTTGKVVGTLTTDAHGKASTSRAETVDGAATQSERTHDPARPWMGAGKRNERIAGALPYDRAGYTVREVASTTPEGYLPCPDWVIDAQDIADGTHLHYIVDNDKMNSRLQVVKTDAENGQTIPLAGFAFTLLDANKHLITQEVWYPNHTEVSEFVTDETGSVTLPGRLEPGTYYIRETAARPPYLLPDKEMKVVIPPEGKNEGVILVRMADEQAHGVARIHKTCTEGASCPNALPTKDRARVEDAPGLTGAEFDILAVDDIISPSGTVQATSGELVDHVTTEEDGWATTKKLPLGSGVARYRCIETKAPKGHALDATPHEFILTYQDSATQVVYTDLQIANAPTRLEIHKTAAGAGEPLEGATFAIWNKRDEISVAPDEGGALAVRAPAGATVRAALHVPYAMIDLTAPKGLDVRICGHDGAPRKIEAGVTKMEAGAYLLKAMTEDGAVAIEAVKMDMKPNRLYTVRVSQTIFGLHAHVEEAGDACPPVQLVYEKGDRAHIARGLDAGTYDITIDGNDAHTVEVGAGATYLSHADGTWAAHPILLMDEREPIESSSDAKGMCSVEHLAKGAYRLREVKAPDGFVITSAVHEFTVDARGLIEGAQTHAIDVENDCTKVDISKRDITDEREIAGAHLSVVDAHGNIVDRWTSTAEPHRITHLKPGTYTLIEEKTPRGYDQSEHVEFEILATGEVQKVVMHDKPITIEGAIDKRQEVVHPKAADKLNSDTAAGKDEVVSHMAGDYRYSLDFRNSSSTWVDEFTVTDELICVQEGLATLTGITTPRAHRDYDGKMNVWYTTNMTSGDYIDPRGANATQGDGHKNPWLADASIRRLGEDGRRVPYAGWVLWAQDLATDTSQELLVEGLALQEGEYVTGIRFEYGRVEESFASRPSNWERASLKDPHDDVEKVPSSYGDEGTRRGEDESFTFAPAIIHMRVNDAYKPGVDLTNAAHVELYRNGGGEGLEGHDADHVTQSIPDEPLRALAQTGRVSPAPFMLLGATCIGLTAAILNRARRRGGSALRGHRARTRPKGGRPAQARPGYMRSECMWPEYRRPR